MLAAGRAANALNKPVVFDPVGAGATEFRRHTVRDIMREVKLNVLRCNVGELAAVAEVPWQQKGVDSGEGDLAIVEVAKQVAKQYHTVVAVTGATDIVTDGERVAEISGGSAMTPLVTGTGCLLSAVVAAGLVGSDDVFAATVSVLQDYKRVAEIAAAEGKQVGDFQVAFLNALQQVSEGEGA